MVQPPCKGLGGRRAALKLRQQTAGHRAFHRLRALLLQLGNEGGRGGFQGVHPKGRGGLPGKRRHDLLSLAGVMLFQQRRHRPADRAGHAQPLHLIGKGAELNIASAAQNRVHQARGTGFAQVLGQIHRLIHRRRSGHIRVLDLIQAAPQHRPHLGVQLGQRLLQAGAQAGIQREQMLQRAVKQHTCKGPVPRGQLAFFQHSVQNQVGISVFLLAHQRTNSRIACLVHAFLSPPKRKFVSGRPLSFLHGRGKTARPVSSLIGYRKPAKSPFGRFNCSAFCAKKRRCAV